MKKYLKSILLICLLAVCMLSLCSCNMIDELKSKHIIYDDNNPEKVEFRGEKYVKITLSPYVTINYGMSETVYAKEEGFPLLFLEDFGVYSLYHKKSDIIRINVNGYAEIIYAHEDKAEEYRKVIEKNDLSYLKFDYYEYDQVRHERVEKSYILEDELMRIINELPTKFEASEINSGEILHCLELIRCDETNLLESDVNSITILQSRNGDFFVKKGTFKYDDKLEGILVPVNDKARFMSLVSNALNKDAEKYKVFYN